MITTKTLITAGPFSDDKKKQLLEKFDTFTDDQRMRLAHAAWTGIAMKYHVRLKYEFDKLHLEVAEGKRDYNANDLVEVTARLTREVAQSLQSAETEEQIGEVREQLEKFKTQPMPQDKVTTTPPSQKP